jgi:hypothetical protein
MLLMPNYCLVHPDTERRVRVIGLIHAGEPRYYLEIKQIVEMLRLGGAEVHSEGTGLGDLIRNPPPDLTAEEKEILELQVTVDRGNTRHATADPGWVHQYAGFGGWPTGWQRIDLPYLSPDVRILPAHRTLRRGKRVSPRAVASHRTGDMGATAPESRWTAARRTRTR